MQGARRTRGGQSYLLDYSAATFTRSSEAAAVDPRDGWAFYDLVTPWPGVDVLRQPEAAHALIEGGRTNLITYSADFTNAAWVKGGTPSPAVSATAAPDGGTAYDLTDNAAAHEFVEITATLTVTGDHTVSAYFLKDSVTTRFPGLRIAAGTATLATSSSHEVHLNTQTGATAAASGAPARVRVTDAGDWWRVSFVVTATVTGTVVVDVLPARATTIGTPNVAAVGTATAWGVQLEAGGFASTPIRTSGATGTRAAESCTFSPTGLPSALLTGAFSLDVTPEFASTEIPFAQTVWIGARGVTNGFLGPNNSVGGIRFRGPSGFVDRVCTWSAGQTLTITVDHAAGTLTVAGATTGNGTSTGTATGGWTGLTSLDVALNAATGERGFSLLSQPRAA